MHIHCMLWSKERYKDETLRREPTKDTITPRHTYICWLMSKMEYYTLIHVQAVKYMRRK